jgi:A/G-specific adenine glycosylase
MELGATVCTPRQPACARCPVQRHCSALREGRIGDFPRASAKPAVRQRKFVAVVLRRDERVLVRQRPADVVNGGLWEFPNFEAARRPALAIQIESFLGQSIALEELATIRHTITNNRIALKVLAGPAPTQHLSRRLGAKWLSIGQLHALPFSSAHAKIRARLSAP